MKRRHAVFLTALIVAGVAEHASARTKLVTCGIAVADSVPVIAMAW